MQSKYLRFFTATMAAVITFGGCADKSDALARKGMTHLMKSADGRYVSSMKREMEKRKYSKEYADRIASKKKNALDRKLSADFDGEALYYAMKQISFLTGIPIDDTFKPSSEYRITGNYDGVTLKTFLYDVYNQTGVKYGLEGGYLRVLNAPLVNEGVFPDSSECGRSERISIKMKNPSFKEVLTYFEKKFGFSFKYDLRYRKLRSGNFYTKAKDFSYDGCDPKEALLYFLDNNGLAGVELRDGVWEIRDWMRWEADVSPFFDMTFASAGALSGSSGGDASGGVKLSMKENLMDEYAKRIASIVGDKNKFVVSPRGYVMVEDKIPVVRKVKSFLLSESVKQRPIRLSVDVYRIKLKDGISAGISVSELIRNTAGGLFNHGKIAVDSAPGGVFKLQLSGRERKLLFEAMSDYADITAVRRFHTNVRSGFVVNFKSVTQLPYVTASTIVQNGLATTATDVKYVQAGLIINVMPNVDRKRKEVDLSTNIVLSEYLGDKTVNIDGNKFVLPIISSNEANVPSRVELGSSVILTGFRAKSDFLEGNGVPGASRSGLLGYVMGKKDTKSDYSDFVIVISPEESDI